MTSTSRPPDLADPGSIIIIMGNQSIDCGANFAIVVHPAYLAVTMPQLVSPLICLFLVVTFAFRFFKMGTFHKNAKILVASQLFFTSMYCLVFVFTHGQLAINLIFQYDDKCSVTRYASDCVVVYYALIASVTGMCSTQVCIGIERIVSSVYIMTYEKFGITLGVLLICCTVAAPATVCLIVLSDFNPLEPRLTCMGVPITAGSKATFLYYVIIAFDLITVVLFAITLKINTKLNCENRHDSLVVKYQKRENKNVIKMFLPNLVAHCFVYCFFSISAIIIRANQKQIDPTVYSVVAVVINGVPHYTAFEFTMLHIILSKQIKKAQEFQRRLSEHQRSTEKDIYFANYTQHWQ